MKFPLALLYYMRHPPGVAGLAGLVEASVEDGSVVGVLFTGIDRENEVSA